MSQAPADASPTPTIELVHRCAAGDAAAYDTLFSAIYADLHARAHRLLHQAEGVTLSTTALVHETYLKLVGRQLELTDRTHFFCIASRAMRQVLMNAARERCALKRGGDQARITLSALTTGAEVDLLNVLSLDDALTALAKADERLAQVVELHFFAGLGFAELAELLELSERTVARDWRTARALLRQYMGEAQ